MDHSQAAADIRSFLLEAGAHALNIQSGVERHYKKGEQAVTKADIDVSHMAKEKLGYWLEQEGHVLIDEESIDTIPGPEEVFATTRYQWVLDPIDGTAGYALGRDRWGVSLGLLEEGCPIGGGIYLPAIGALIMIEDGAAYYTNMRTGEKRPISQAHPMEINSQIFIDSFFGFENYKNAHERHSNIWLNTPESALQGGYSVFMGQTAATIFIELYSVWDIAGIAAIAKATGHKIMSLEDGYVFEQCTARYFEQNWKLANKWILGHPENYKVIKDALTGR